MTKKTKKAKKTKQQKKKHTLELTLRHSGNRTIKITGVWTGLELNSKKVPISKMIDQEIEAT